MDQLTKREQFAMAALQGMMANTECYYDWPESDLARTAFRYADAFVEEALSYAPAVSTKE